MKKSLILLLTLAVIMCTGCMAPGSSYELEQSYEVEGRQGIAYYNGCLYMTADDGDADKGEPDHLYRARVTRRSESAEVVLEKTFDDVKSQGEIEGLSFDRKAGKLLLLYNRGAKIKLGMPKGFYPG